MRIKKENASASTTCMKYPYWGLMFVAAIIGQASLAVVWNQLRGSVAAAHNDSLQAQEVMQQRHLRSHGNNIAVAIADVELQLPTATTNEQQLVSLQNINSEKGNPADATSSPHDKEEPTPFSLENENEEEQASDSTATPSFEQPWPKPEGWDSYSQGEMHRHFQCGTYARDQKKTFPTLAEYQLFREKYKEHVNQEETFDDDVLPTMGYNHDGKGPPPYYAGYTSDGKGRGLFASRNIKMGEIVHDGTYKDRLFPTGMSYREFVFDLPRKNACDMLEWCWTQKLADDGKFKLLCTFNISILMNSSGNGYNVMPESSRSQRFRATRDIAKDDEILMDYSVYETRWDEVGLD